MNFLAVSSQRGQRSEGKLNSCKPSKERVRTCKEYVIGREISPEAMVITWNLFPILQVFIMGLGKLSKFCGCFIVAS